MSITPPNGVAPRTTRDWVRVYLRGGERVVPLRPRSNAPAVTGFQDIQVTEDSLTAYFPEGEERGVALLLGETIDLDIDCAEGVRAAPLVLPATNRIMGRPGNPASHYFYRVGEADRPEQQQTAFRDTDGTVLVEVKAAGAPAAVPPSVHPDGEARTWDRWGEPARLAEPVLQVAGR